MFWVCVCICEYKRVCAIILRFFLSFGLIVQHFLPLLYSGLFSKLWIYFSIRFHRVTFFLLLRLLRLYAWFCTIDHRQVNRYIWYALHSRAIYTLKCYNGWQTTKPEGILWWALKFEKNQKSNIYVKRKWSILFGIMVVLFWYYNTQYLIIRMNLSMTRKKAKKNIHVPKHYVKSEKFSTYPCETK